MAFVLDTVDLPATDRIDAVYTAMMVASAPCYVVHEKPHRDVRTRICVWDLGAANIFTTASTGLRLLRTPRLARRDDAPVLALSVQQAADGRHEQFGRQQVVAPGELMAVDLSAPYDFSWSGDGAAGCVQFPLDQLALPVDLVRRAAANLPASPLYGLVTHHVAHLTRDADRLSTDLAAPALGAATIELARALLVSAAHTSRHTRAVLAETLLTQARAYARHHLADPDLRPSTIAAALNVSVRYLYKVCAQADLSLEQWIIGERLAKVREELARSDSRNRSIALVARRWGFTDPSHFARRFRSAYGVTPSEWRRLSGQ